MLSQLVLLVHNNADGSSTTCNIDVATLSFMVLDTILGAFKDGAYINCELFSFNLFLLSPLWTPLPSYNLLPFLRSSYTNNPSWTLCLANILG